MSALVTTTFLFVVLDAASAVRTITVLNACSQSIWPAIFTSDGSAPSASTGWEAAPGTSLTFQANSKWSGKVWARTSCDFSDTTKSGAQQCATGGCADGLLCASFVSGVPASAVELSLAAVGSTSGPDFYDVSLVDGFNLPVVVELANAPANCPAAGCTKNLLPDCPAQIAVKAGGSTVACSSACRANVDGTPANSSNCCTGSFSSPSACPPSKTQFYDFFKGECPAAYASPFDDAASLVASCSTSGTPNAQYKITFCPGNTLAASTSAPVTPGPSTSSSSASSTSTSAGRAQSSSSTSPAPVVAARRNTRAIAGVVLGVLGCLAALAGLLLSLYARRRAASQPMSAHPAPMTAASSTRAALLSAMEGMRARSNIVGGSSSGRAVSAPSSSGAGPPSEAAHIDMPPPAYSTISYAR